MKNLIWVHDEARYAGHHATKFEMHPAGSQADQKSTSVVPWYHHKELEIWARALTAQGDLAD